MDRKGKEKREKRKGEGRTLPEHGAKYSHQSQGSVEQAVKAVEGLTRTLLHTIADHVGVEFDSEDAVSVWAVRHAGYLLTHTRVMPNGRTPSHVLRGKEFRGELCIFGEVVWARDMTPAADNAKITVRWKRSVWLGKIDVSDEHLVGDGARLQKTRTVRRLPEGVGELQRWDRGAVTGLTALPWGESEGTMQDAARSTRRRYITTAEVAKHLISSYSCRVVVLSTLPSTLPLPSGAARR